MNIGDNDEGSHGVLQDQKEDHHLVANVGHERGHDQTTQGRREEINLGQSRIGSGQVGGAIVFVVVFAVGVFVGVFDGVVVLFVVERGHPLFGNDGRQQVEADGVDAAKDNGAHKQRRRKGSLAAVTVNRRFF